MTRLFQWLHAKHYQRVHRKAVRIADRVRIASLKAYVEMQRHQGA